MIGDRIIEPDETFLVNLKNPKGAKISNSQATVIITDDDPRVSIANASATEGNTGTSALNFTVSLSGATDVPVTVNYSTQDGTALAGTDYQAATGSVTFAAGEISKTIAVQMIGERVAESDEYFYLNLQPGTNAIIAQGQGQATGTIVDDEPLVSIAAASADEGHSSTTPMTFTVSLSAASDLPVTVNYSTQDVTAGAGADYVAASGSVTFAVGETSKTIPVSVIGDRFSRATKPSTSISSRVLTPTSSPARRPEPSLMMSQSSASRTFMSMKAPPAIRRRSCSP